LKEVLAKLSGKKTDTNMNYIQERAKKHTVTHEFSGKKHFFKVASESGEDHNVSIQLSCDCTFMSVQGVANGQICSHILAAINKISKDGGVKDGYDKNKRN